MAIKLTSTRDAALLHGLKIFTYGRAGAGKTTLCGTLPDPLIISAESGLLSLAGQDLPVAEIESIADLEEVFTYVRDSAEARRSYKSLALDSVSEIAEKVLAAEKAVNKDPRAAYGALVEQMTALIRGFRDLSGFHVYFAAKQGQEKDEVEGTTFYGPSMPGRMVGPALPYLFDEVFVLRIGETEDGTPYRYLQTQPDYQYTAKDRSGLLDPMEPPHLGKVIDKILAGIQPTPKATTKKTARKVS